jgi:hypothetical protein
LRWYDNGCTEEGYKVIKKYARLSEVTCIRCGQPATKISSGWISPYCDEHFDEKWGIYAEIVNGEIVYPDDEDDLEEESEQLLEEYSEAYKKLAE